MDWVTLHYKDLTKAQWYDITKLRQDVFIVEQQCAYPDIDGKDRNLHHLMAYDAGHLVAYTRLIPLSMSFDGALSIGRVLVDVSARGRGLALELMRRSIIEVRRLFGDEDIVIGAQSHLKNMYQSLGFEKCSDEYLEDGIPHIDMILRK